MPTMIAKTHTGIGRKAEIVQRDDVFQVYLYNTMIYEETPSAVMLSHGGWITPTTARYINQALNYRGFHARVSIRNGSMIVVSNGRQVGEVTHYQTMFRKEEIA